jgi:integrase/recombinase XerD
VALIRENEIISMQRSFVLFENSINSEGTLELYKKGLNTYMKFVEYFNRYDEYLMLDSELIHKHLEDFVMFHRSRKVKGTTIRTYLKPIYLFLDVNRKHYFPKSINKQIPKDKTKKGNDKPFTDEDIQSMLDYTNSSRNKALVLFFSSIGGRSAVLVDPILCFKHLYSMPFGCKAILMYSGSNEEYWGFLTPESSKALEKYRDERIRDGEIITPNSPLFAVERKSRFKNDNCLRLSAVYSIFDNLEKRAHIEKIKTGNRYDKALIYGFRKRFNTILKIDSDVNSNIAEKLMAHKNGLDGVYFKPTREECFSEFIKAIPQLTVSRAEKLAIKLENSENEKDMKIKRLEIEMKEIQKLLERINIKSPSIT